MSIQLEIHKHNLQRVNNIFNGFEGQDMSKDISKAITEEEFHERFSAGYQVFTKSNIKDFVKAMESDLIEKGFDSTAISTALDNEGKTLESVLVKKDGKIFEVFVKSIDTDIEKSGEGSKGGKVIGHTKSGKPIYAGKRASDYKDFSKEDHADARVKHLANKTHSFADEHSEEFSKEKPKSDSSTSGARNHTGMGDALKDSKKTSKPKKEKEDDVEDITEVGESIGKTSSGKHVYSNKHPNDYKDFSKEDHKEAAVMHKDRGNKNTDPHHIETGDAHKEAMNKIKD